MIHGNTVFLQNNYTYILVDASDLTLQHGFIGEMNYKFEENLMQLAIERRTGK